MKHNMQNSSCFSPPKAIKQQQQGWFFWLQRKPASEDYSQKSNFQNLRHLYSQPPFTAQNNVASCYSVQPSTVTSSFSDLVLHLFLPFSVAQAIERSFSVSPPSSCPLLSNIFLTFVQSCGLFFNISEFSELFQSMCMAYKISLSLFSFFVELCLQMDES